MAKGEFDGKYVAQNLDTSSLEALAASVARELEHITNSFEYGPARRLDKVHVEPNRPRDGHLLLADGSNWDPGAGPGLYFFNDGEWHFLAPLSGFETLTEGKIWIGGAANVPVEQSITGDVTLTSAGVVTIVADAVTFAKMQNITEGKLLGRSAGADGDMMHINVGSGLTLAAGTLACTITQYTDELAQDAIGAMIDSTLVYVDGTPLLTRAAISGDGSIAQGSNTFTLANVNSDVGTYGDSTHTVTITVNAKGQVTAISQQAVVTSGSGGLTRGQVRMLPYLGGLL